MVPEWFPWSDARKISSLVDFTQRFSSSARKSSRRPLLDEVSRSLREAVARLLVPGRLSTSPRSFARHHRPRAARSERLSDARATSRHAERHPRFSQSPLRRRPRRSHQRPCRPRARCDGPPRRPPRGAGHTRCAPARRLRIALRLLPRRARPLRGRGLQPHRGRPSRPPVSGDPRDAGLRGGPPDHGEAPRSPLDGGQPPRGARVGPREEEGGGREDRRAALATARRPAIRPEASGTPARGRTAGGAPSDARAVPLVPPLTAAALPATVLAAPALPARPAAVAPLSPDRYKLQLTIGGETLEKLRLAQDMLGHAIPSGDEAAILDRAFTALLEDLAKQKFADTRKPRRSRGTKPGTRSRRRPRSSVPSGCATSGGARSWRRAATAATSAGSWSSITSTRMSWEANRASIGSPFAVGATTTTRAGSTSASAGVRTVARGCARTRHRMGRSMIAGTGRARCPRPAASQSDMARNT